jgi:hypothetical protein
MRAVLVRAHGPHNSPHLEEIPDLAPRERDVAGKLILVPGRP